MIGVDPGPASSAGPASLRRLVDRVVALAPVAFVVIAEASWIAVVGGLVQEFSHRDPVLGIPSLAGFVVAGIAAARALGPRLHGRWPVAGLALVVLGGATGWLASPDSRSALAGGIGPALAAHPGGLVAALAVLRGFAHAGMPLAEGTVSRLLAIGIPGLATAALLGGAIADPFRARFLADALGESIVFVAAAVLALTFARLGAVGVDGGFDWRGNPAWLGLTVLLIVGAIVVAVPLSSVAGTAISVVVSAALGPMLVIGLVTGFDRAARRILAFAVVAVAIAFLLTRGPFRVTLPNPNASQVGGQGEASTAEQVVGASLGGLLLIAAVVGVLILIAVWMRRVQPADDAVLEERTIDRGGDEIVQPLRRNRFGRRIDPRTADQAWIALIDDLERHPDVRRDPAETPAEHAGRLRADRRPGLALDLLAADYALARYGSVELSAREDRRAVARWRALRRSLIARDRRAASDKPDGGFRPGGRAGPADGPLPDLEPRRTF